MSAGRFTFQGSEWTQCQWQTYAVRLLLALAELTLKLSVRWCECTQQPHCLCTGIGRKAKASSCYKIFGFSLVLNRNDLKGIGHATIVDLLLHHDYVSTVKLVHGPRWAIFCGT
jgi:hypothetical protein